MIRHSFKMKLYEGQEQEYIKRYNQLWNNMKDAIHKCGGSNYSIFFDNETNILYGYIEIESEEKWASINQSQECKKWWDFMKDIMETNEDNSPVSSKLKEVFNLN